MRGRSQLFLSVGWGVALLLGSPLAVAADAPRDDAHLEVGTPEAVAAARAHFTKGRDLYQAGSYREAIVELDAARALDPKAKDLVFNLGVVHEKLGEVDEALRYARLYAQMDLEPAERARAETYIKRLEGAKLEVLAKEASAMPPPSAPEARVRGRIDAATITAAAVAVGAAGAGVVFGIKALGDKPSTYTVSPTLSVKDLQNQQNNAHGEGIVADACFGGAIAAAAVAAGLYFARYRDPAPRRTSLLVVAPLVLPSTGGVVLGGAF